MVDRLGSYWLLVLPAVVLSGCATSRSEIKLGSESAQETKPASIHERVVVIRSVVDKRVFEEAPKHPGTPSLGFEGSKQATADVKARAIGRKRNTYGMALGDILLDKDQTVVGVVRSNLARGLREGGYKLAADVGSAGVSPILVDVDVKTFWAWMQPGFWALTLHGDITTELRIEGRAEPVVITVETKDSVQLGTDGAWMEILENALKEYRERIIARSASLRAP